MKPIDILIKSIILLHRERQVDGEVGDSKDLIRTILSLLKNKKNIMGGEYSTINDIKNLITDMMHNPDSYEEESLLQSLALILKDKDNIYKIIEKNILNNISQPGIKRSIVAIRNTLNNFYKEEEIKRIVSTASYRINNNQLGDTKLTDYVTEIITTLEAYTSTTKAKDPGVMDEIDIGDEDNMTDTLDKVISQNEGVGKLMTGWKELNDMLQGGFKPGEMVMINALQFNYKSGFTRTIFMQIAMHNKPVMLDIKKKPLLLLISFEDDADITLDFMYKYLYYNEHLKLPDLTTITTSEVAKYIKSKLTVNGFNIKIIRVNPSEWTYKHMFNKVLELEAAGFEIKAMFVDYLAKLPTVGCMSGPTGSDYKDLFNRCRNFASSKQFVFITPHQLSTDAKQLTRNGVPDINFVKEVKGKGYFDHSKALDQIVDLEIYLHRAKLNKKPVLTVARGKHRTPNILDDDKMYFILPFPKGAPIKENINDKVNEFGLATDLEEDNDIF